MTARRAAFSLNLSRRTVAFGLATLPLALAISRPAVAADVAGHVDSAEGSSTGLLEGSVRDLANGADVHLEELVETAAAARLGLALGAETHLKLGERTRIKIEQSLVDQGGEMVLERGAMLFERPDEGGGGDISVETPFAVIAARGTAFFVGPSNGVIGVFVEHGTVEVTNAGGSVVLEAGEGTDLTSFDVAPTPPREWGAGRIEAALASVN